MRTNIIEDLRPFYLKNPTNMYRLLKNPLLLKICDAYFKEGLTAADIAIKIRIPLNKVKQLLIRGCGKIIRNRHHF